MLKTKNTKINDYVLSSNANANAKKSKDVKFHVVYRLDFAVELKKRGHIEAFSKKNPQKPWLVCWYFVETESFLTDLQELMEVSKDG